MQAAFHTADSPRHKGSFEQDQTLVVDLDGTITPVDTLVESFLRLARNSPWQALAAFGWLLQGRAYMKSQIAQRANLDVSSLPLNEPMVAYLRQQREAGRPIILATAADRRIAEAMAERIGVFDSVHASDGTNNLKGKAKLAEIREQVGDNFAYAGDSQADLPIWQAAKAAVLVGVPPDLARQVRKTVKVEREFDSRRAGAATWFKALRAHQWIKNLLIFLPLLTSFSFSSLPSVSAALLGFVAFSLLASATYIGNDLWDLESDRAHPRKRARPFASGAISPLHGVAVAMSLLLASMLVALWVTPAFVGILLLYLVATTAYSWDLKRRVLIDVVALALLYTLRVLAGAVAIGVQVTPWLLAFCTFFFLSLALVKRCSELVSAQRDGRSAASGRGYLVSDLSVLWPLGVSSGMCAVVVFGLFVADTATIPRYANHDLLWCVGIGLIYWIGRLWIKTGRGQMHDDPIVFTAKDKVTRMTLVAIVLLTVAAHFPIKFL